MPKKDRPPKDDKPGKPSKPGKPGKPGEPGDGGGEDPDSEDPTGKGIEHTTGALENHTGTVARGKILGNVYGLK